MRTAAAILATLLALGAWEADFPTTRQRCAAQETNSTQVQRLAEALHGLVPHVFSAERRGELASMVRDDQRRRLRAANDASRTQWEAIAHREAWEAFRNPRLAALRRSLGEFPDPPPSLDARVTGTIVGDGFRIENVVFASRPGLWVTANLYVPDPPRERSPGILLCHSHHRPKEHGELQDMGMTWARAGCCVLVMDHLGHGERRQHAFRTEADYPGPFRLSRQDYYFRYDTGMQLHLAGESLIGWMAWDLMRGVDLLLARPEVDPQRIILLGAVAGGGDPAAVAAALDERIAAAVPFNFGGPQPETRYPLPDDAETWFNYAGSGSWESTRNLRRSAADGFLPWVIVGGIAPRRLVYAHEFAWDQPRDPVWRRLEKIYAFYDAPDHLAFTHGRGGLSGQPPEATHCTHIGAAHRVLIHAAFQRWFGISVTPADEYSQPLAAERLTAMTPQAEQALRPRPLREVLAELAAERMQAAQDRRRGLPLAEQRRLLREDWQRVLGDIAPSDRPRLVEQTRSDLAEGVRVERLALEVEPGTVAPLLLLTPRAKEVRTPVVVAVAQEGKEGFLRNRATSVAELLAGGAAVCLPDVRGVGETRPGNDRGRQSEATALASTELMLGGTLVGARLRDVRSVLRYLRTREDLDPQRIALWGDSFAEPNPPETDFRIPRDAAPFPRQAEPLGGLLALLGALYEDDLAAVYVQGGLANYRSALESALVLLPHDAILPGALPVGDLEGVAAAVAPRPVRLDNLVDGLHRRLAPERARQTYAAAGQSYEAAGQPGRLSINDDATAPSAWLLRGLAE